MGFVQILGICQYHFIYFFTTLAVLVRVENKYLHFILEVTDMMYFKRFCAIITTILFVVGFPQAYLYMLL